jgi:ATP-binding cassette subfamily C protein LapB
MLLEAMLRYGRSWMLNRVGTKFDAESSVDAMTRLLTVPDSALKNLGHNSIEDGFNALKQLREYQSGQALLALYDAPFVILFLALIAYVGVMVVFIPLLMLVIACVCLFTGKRCICSC